MNLLDALFGPGATETIWSHPHSEQQERLRNQDGTCVDCGYSIYGPNGEQRDLLNFGRCLKCFMKWRGALNRGAERG